MKIITKNKIAKFRYEFKDKFEAGIALSGTEIKSIREGNVELRDAYVFISDKQEATLINCHIATFKHGNINNHEPKRSRKLLLNKSEIKKIANAKKLDGLTCVPYTLYINNKGKAKLEIYTAKGKNTQDKRQTIKARDEKRHQARQVKRNSR